MLSQAIRPRPVAGRLRAPPSRVQDGGEGSLSALLFLALLLLALLLLALTAVPSSAQNVVVDEGTFLLSRNGQPIGTESFTIRRSGRGQDVRFIATGETRIEADGRERRLTSALEATSPEMKISAYQVKEAGDRRSEIYMTVKGQRFQATLRSPEGEELREYRATPAAVILEKELAHHYFFLVARISGTSATVPAIVPSTGQGPTLEITDAGTERTSIAGRTVQATHLVVEGGDETRDVWIDDQKRILRVVNRASGFRAERRNPPGE